MTLASDDPAVTALQVLDNAIAGTEMQVDVVAALPAGTNNIGDVDVLTIAAGDNNIGNVDIVTLPATTVAGATAKTADLDSGAGTDTVSIAGVAVAAAGGAIAITGDATNGLDVDVTRVTGTVTVDGSGVTQPVSHAALTELAAAINASSQMDVNIAASAATLTVASHAVTNAGTFAVQVDAALPAGTNAIGKLAANTGVDIGDVDVTSVIPGTGATNLGKAIDSVGGATDTGVVPLAIRDDALTALTPVDGDYVALRVNSTGALHVTGGGGGTQYNIDDVASATATGTVALVVRKDTGASLAGTDGDITGLQVDASGALRVTGGGGGTEYTVDAVAPAAPVGTTLVMERDDALSALTEVEGDWTNVRANANGALWTTIDGTVTVGSHAVTNAGTFAVQVDGAALTALQLIDNLVLAEDAAHVSADPGVQMLAVRKATPANVSGTDGDYEPLQVSAGRLWASATIDAALPAGTNGIGKLTANSGVDIGDVDVTSISAGTNTIGNVGLVGRTTGGMTIFNSIDLDESEEEIKATAGQIFSISAFNTTAAPLWLRFYNATAANTTVGTTAAHMGPFMVPANADSDGAGFVWNNSIGAAFGTAISAAVTTGVASTDTGAPGANACVVVVGYV